MARLPGLLKRTSKAEELELELARQGSMARLERLLAERAGTYVEGDEETIELDQDALHVDEAGADIQAGPGAGTGETVEPAETFEPVDDIGGRDTARTTDAADLPPATVVGIPVMALEAIDVTRRRAVRRPPSLQVVDDHWDTDAATVGAGGSIPADAGPGTQASNATTGSATTDAAPTPPRSRRSAIAITSASAGPGKPATKKAPVEKASARKATATSKAAAARTPVVPPPPPRVRPPAAAAAHPKRAARQPRLPVVLAACPSCAVLLDPRPRASRRCTECRERIVVKRVEGGVLYLTSQAAMALEAAQRRLVETARLTRLRGRWLALASGVGAPPAGIERIGRVVATEDGVQAARALYLGAAGRAFLAARREHRFAEAASIRRAHALVLVRELGAPDDVPDEIVDLYRDAMAAELRSLREYGRDAELVAAQCCDACGTDAGLIVRISEEVKLARLPHAGCPKRVCACRWTATRVSGRRPDVKAARAR